LQKEVRQNAAAMASYQMQSASALGPSGVEQWVSGILGQSAAAKKLQTQLAASAVAVRNLQDGLSKKPSLSLIQDAEKALKVHQRLGEQNLSGLKSAIDSARQKMESLNDSAKSTLDSLRDQWDELNGNEIAKENRRYANEQLDIQKQLAEAKAANNSSAMNDLRSALEYSRKIHSQTLETFEQSKQVNNTEPSNTAAATPQQPQSVSTPVTKVFEIKVGGVSAQISADDKNADALEGILKQLESAKSVYGG